MALVSAITIAGNLTGDPEVRKDRNDKSVCRIRIASTPRKFNRDTKEYEDGEPNYINCVAFGAMADNIASTLSKGMRVVVHGELKQENWTDKESGVAKTDKSITIEDIGPSLMFDSFMKADRRAASAPQGGDGFGGQGGWASDSDMPF